MQYPLPEVIGNPDLFVGRKQEFALLNHWTEGIPGRRSKSRVLLARRKSGKTAVVQRIFNRLWSEHGQVIPFYINIEEQRTWLMDLADIYYRTFVSQYISFVERDESLASQPLTLKEIKEYGLSKSISAIVSSFRLHPLRR